MSYSLNEPEEQQPWCARCEHWLEDCECEEPQEPERSEGWKTHRLSLDQTESCCQFFDNEADRYWNENVRDYPK